MSKKIKLVEISAASTSENSAQAASINWELCVLCQAGKSESLTSPSLSKRKEYTNHLLKTS